MKIFSSHRCLEYSHKGHPESPKRVKLILKELQGYEIPEAKPCQDKDLFLCHTKELINKVRQGKFFDADTPSAGMFDFAKLAAGGAMQAAMHAVDGENAFSLMRPPGHHAGKNFLGGFCYFNSVAIAVENSLKQLDKVAIIDIDGHHGNGTQDIFMGRKDVLFVSLHQKNAFPVSGFVSEQNCFNYPLPPETEGKNYMKIFLEALRIVENFNPDLIAVSAGFDTYKKDPLLQMAVGIETYFQIGGAIRHLGKPAFAVLEGGYSEDIGKCAYQFLKGLG